MAEAAPLTEDWPERFFHVALRKYGLNLAWWRDVYLHVVFRPFLRFSLRIMGIPTPSEIEILPDGTRRWVWLEGIGIATEKWIADRMCKSEFYRVDPLPINSALPEESIYTGQQWWPRASKPDRWRGPIPPFATAKSVSEAAAEEKGLEAAISKVDELRVKARASSNE